MAAKSFQGLFSPLEVVSTNNLLRIQQDQCKIHMTRIYYSSIFKSFYLAVIIFSIICIGITVLQIYYKSSFLLILEGFVTIMLVFDVAYRGFMQGWRNYLKLSWNIIDIVILVLTVGLLWFGIEKGGGIGEIDTITAVFAIITRAIVQFLRLISAIKKKKEHDVQIIDLSEVYEPEKKIEFSINTFERIEEEEKKHFESQSDV